MKMQVETFEQNEVVGGKIEDENSPEALMLIESLGLSGQKAMTTKTIETGDTVRCPYRKMTIKEARVYEHLYPHKISIEDYRESMIPLRVLQVAAHAKELNFYKKVVVWCEHGRPTDPVLVGVVQNGQNSWQEDVHILARWGDALESFEVLYEKAKKSLIEEYRLKIIEVKQRASQIETSLEFHATKHLSGEFVHLPS